VLSFLFLKYGVSLALYTYTMETYEGPFYRCVSFGFCKNMKLTGLNCMVFKFVHSKSGKKNEAQACEKK